MAERTHDKSRNTDIPKNKDDRPSQLLAFSFLYGETITDTPTPGQTEKNNVIHLQSNEITFFHSQKSVWFRQLLKQ